MVFLGMAIWQLDPYQYANPVLLVPKNGFKSQINMGSLINYAHPI